MIVPFKTITQYDDTLEKGKSIIKQERFDGSSFVMERIIVDGQEEIGRRNIKQSIVKNPIDKIVLIETREVKEENLYYIVENLDLTENPSTKSKAIDNIPKGTHLNYISSIGNYYKVNYNNKIGYVLSKNVNMGKGYKVNNTIIVNKGYNLSSDFNPGINPEALHFLNKMKKDNVILNVLSDFRSYSYQSNLNNRDKGPGSLSTNLTDTK